jgi:dihydroorotate dehydrogenase
MSLYRLLWPITRRLPPEFAHSLALNALRLPLRLGKQVDDPYTWEGLTFRNRAGIAAGFDKNASCVRGIERLGAGFVEVGTILVEPWAGNQVTPRMARLLPQRAIWNRLGFTSRGLEAARRNLERVPSNWRRGMVVACNIGPHPGNLRDSAEPLITARDEFLRLVDVLYPLCEMFVINLSSPNTRGLRNLLQDERLADAVLRPIRERVRALDTNSRRAWRTPLLVKLPPEDQDRKLWTMDSLRPVIGPLTETQLCDGFVAVNTSTRLAQELVNSPPADLPGGISGDPLRAEALRVVSLVRGIIGPGPLLMGCGGVMEPAHAVEFLNAGANLVEMYSGMIYAGPGLVSGCAEAIRFNRPTPFSGRPC